MEKLNLERLCIVMPVYNEQAVISSVLEKWARYMDTLGIDYTIRAYNDGSTDGSLEKMRCVASKFQKVDVRDKPNGGHGNTVLTGYREAAADGFDWIFQVDSDDEMSPESFEELWSNRCDYDFIVGRRENRKQSWTRKIVSTVSRWCTRIFYGKSVSDVNSPYRLMRTSVFKPYYEKLSMATFAPNVILSGLAASHGLRCLELDVRHQDRKSGEVSIKKWKLFKAAVKSFTQTVWFSFVFRTGNSLIGSGVILSLLFGAYTAVKLNFNSLGWVDEVGTADTAVNLALHGKWFSHNWPYSYHPLHMWLLVPWLKIFGVSHVSVCSFNVMWAAFSCLLVICILVQRKIFAAVWQVFLFCMLFWGTVNLSWTAMSGRIDCMVMFFTVCVVGLFMREARTDSKTFLLSLVIAAFLMTMTGIYTIPLFIVFWIMCVARPFGHVPRTLIFKRGIAVGIGCVLSLVVVAAYYLHHQAFFRYLYMTFCHCTTVSGISIGSTVGFCECYLTEWHVSVVLLIAGIVCSVNHELRARTNWHLYAFTLFIPCLMVAAGRYAWYYHWIFSLPVGIFICWGLASANLRRCVRLVVLIVVLILIYQQIAWFTKCLDYQKSIPQKEFSALISRNQDLFSSTKDIVVSRYWCYYPSLEAGLQPWVREPELADSFLRTTVNRADAAIDRYVKNEKWREIAKRLLGRMEKIASSRFPEKGYLFVHNAEAEYVMRSVLTKLHYFVESVDMSGDLRLLRFAVNRSEVDR